MVNRIAEHKEMRLNKSYTYLFSSEDVARIQIIVKLENKHYSTTAFTRALLLLLMVREMHISLKT